MSKLLEAARNGAVAAIQESQLSPSGDKLQMQLLPSIRLHSSKDADAGNSIGTSRIGGLPDLPNGWEWPSWDGYPDKNEYLAKAPTPLSFIAQLNLAELPHDLKELPESGILYFFFDEMNQPWGFDPRDRGGFRVLFFTGDQEQLQPVQPPKQLADNFVFQPCAIRPSLEMTLPDFPEDVEFTEGEDEAYSELREKLIGSWGEVHNRMFGHPQIIQNDMRIECQLVSNGIYCGDASVENDPRVEALRPGAADWILLLQIDTDEENPGWMWGDCGRIYYWIRRDDLNQGDFDGVWLCLQCF